MKIPTSLIPAPHHVRDKLQRAYHRLAGSYHRFAVIKEAKNKMDPGRSLPTWTRDRDDNENGMTTKIVQFELVRIRKRACHMEC